MAEELNVSGVTLYKQAFWTASSLTLTAIPLTFTDLYYSSHYDYSTIHKIVFHCSINIFFSLKLQHLAHQTEELEVYRVRYLVRPHTFVELDWS